MNKDFWKQFADAPRIDCVQMKHEIQEQIFADTLGMTRDERAAYRQRRATVFRTGKPWQRTLVPAVHCLQVTQRLLI